MPGPKVTVCIPNRNGAAHLEATIRSVLAQTHADVRVIVADNASTDRSREICDGIRDPRLEFRYESDLLPVSQNWNRALGYAESEFVALLHSDDVWRPDFLRVMIDRLEASPAADAAVCMSGLIDESGAKLESPDRPTMEHPRRSGPMSQRDYEALLLGMYVRPCAWLARRRLFGTIQFDPRFNRAPDWDFWLRVAANPSLIVFESSTLSDYRLHASNDTFTEACLIGIRRDEAILLREALERRPVARAVARRAYSRLEMRSVIQIIQVFLLRKPALAWRLLRILVRTKGIVGVVGGVVQVLSLKESWGAVGKSLRALSAAPSSRNTETGYSAPEDGATRSMAAETR